MPLDYDSAAVMRESAAVQSCEAVVGAIINLIVDGTGRACFTYGQQSRFCWNNSRHS